MPRMTLLPLCISFFTCYYDAYVNGYNSILVLEDDIRFAVEVNTIFAAIREYYTVRDCEIFYLGYCYPSTCSKEQFLQLGKHIFHASDTFTAACTHALVLTKSKACFAVCSAHLYCRIVLNSVSILHHSSSIKQMNNTRRAILSICRALNGDFVKQYMERGSVTYWTDSEDVNLREFYLSRRIGRCVPVQPFVEQNRAELGTNIGNYDKPDSWGCNFGMQNTSAA